MDVVRSSELESVQGADAFPRDARDVEGAATRSDAEGRPDALRAIARRERTYRVALALADALAGAGAFAVIFGMLWPARLRLEFLIVMPLVVAVAKLQGLYDRDDMLVSKSTLEELPALVNLATLLALISWLARKLVVSGAPKTRELLALWVALVALLALARFIARLIAARIAPPERCLLIGSELLRRQLEPKFSGRRAELVGAIPVREVAADHGLLRHSVSGLGVQRVVVSLSDHGDPEETIDVVRGATANGLRVSLLPSSLGVVGSSVAFDELGGVPLLGVPRFGLTRSSRAIKRAFDLAGASLALALAGLPMVVIAIAVKLSSPGPIFFRQTRVGRDDRQFRMVKFRTMVEGADGMKAALAHRNEAGGGLFKIAEDPRVTPLGRLLRASNVDELPQLWNVLRGDMSLVGPRPLRRRRGPARHRLRPPAPAPDPRHDRALAGPRLSSHPALGDGQDRLPLRRKLVAVGGHENPAPDDRLRGLPPRPLGLDSDDACQQQLKLLLIASR